MAAQGPSSPENRRATLPRPFGCFARRFAGKAGQPVTFSAAARREDEPAVTRLPGLRSALIVFALLAGTGDAPAGAPEIREYPVPPGSHPHDVAPAAGGTVWYTARHAGELGLLDQETGETLHIPLGAGSRPHGVIVGPDGAPWITDGGLNAIVRVDPVTDVIRFFPLPGGREDAGLHTATFDRRGALWFTGQGGIYGRLDPATGRMDIFDAPKGRGPYGIAAAPDGNIYFASLAGSYVARIDPDTGAVTMLAPPTPDQGARRVWPDSRSRIWVSEWNAGQLAMYDPVGNTWREWRLPGEDPRPYAVYVDDRDMVWLSDFGANALVRFDPEREDFEVFRLPSAPANVRQLLGRPGEVWGAASGADRLVVVHTGDGNPSMQHRRGVPPARRGGPVSPGGSDEQEGFSGASRRDAAGRPGSPDAR
jgi:virginiamycin B lyase